MAPSVR